MAPTPTAPASLGSDVSTALHAARRSLTRSRATNLTVVALLALGIGSSAATFSVVRGVLAHAVPYDRDGELVQVVSTQPGQRENRVLISLQRFDAYVAGARSFTGFAAFWRQDFTLTGSAMPVSIPGARVSPDFFRTLGITPIRGRDFTADEHARGGAKAVILSEGIWKSQFAGANDVIGKPVSIDGEAVTIVGVVPARFAPPLQDAEIWMPRAYLPDRLPEQQVEAGAGFLSLIGRLKAGVTPEAAEKELQPIVADFRQRFAASRDVKFDVAVMPLATYLVGKVRDSLVFLWLAGSLVFLIACANAGNVLLARLVQRRDELGVRSALGATRRQVVLQLLAECVLLVAGGLALGLLVAWGIRWQLSPLAAQVLSNNRAFAFDGAVVLLTAGLAALAVIVAGVVPALRATAEGRPLLAGDASRGATTGRGPARLRRLLVIAQVAVSYVLLAGALQQMVTLLRLERLGRGFDPAGILTFQIAPSFAKYPTPEARLDLYRRIEDVIATAPGVTAAGASMAFPVGDDQTIAFSPQADQMAKIDDWPQGQFRIVTPGYFRGLGVAMKQGRSFAVSDSKDSPPVAIINETLARRHFGALDPVGRRLFLGSNPVPKEVVGVVADIRQRWLEPEALPEAYIPDAQLPARLPPMYFLVRGRVPTAALLAVVRARLATIDPTQPVTRVKTMEVASEEGLAIPRLRALLVVVFAVLGTLLAAAGVWSMMSQLAAERTRELGIRMALGAPPAVALRLVLAMGVQVGLLGWAAGLVGAVFWGRLAQHALAGVEAPGVPVLMTAGIVLLAAAAGATLLPARRASRLDPVSAMTPR